MFRFAVHLSCVRFQLASRGQPLGADTAERSHLFSRRFRFSHPAFFVCLQVRLQLVLVRTDLRAVVAYQRIVDCRTGIMGCDMAGQDVFVGQYLEANFAFVWIFVLLSFGFGIRSLVTFENESKHLVRSLSPFIFFR